ncbi:Aep3p Ecym_7321 [Eremothecium cymbalariae DBVPG|uniref:ATPase expression protein 3 n=1 Tax=Eremothecium cymbalariae (strain CBS 270.75 / DBVPG 7215 / KCTC 17166 / NRRL Y-17582) TaxID=931890 RepID=G8JWE0_ERECY|nr:hypothetical protein Ecym_7321 [Eremothecium cymbalariae DBVPG\
MNGILTKLGKAIQVPWVADTSLSTVRVIYPEISDVTALRKQTKLEHSNSVSNDLLKPSSYSPIPVNLIHSEVQEYLASMNAPHLVRQNKRNREPYDIERARKFYANVKIIKQCAASNELLFNLTSREVSEIIGSLMRITPKQAVVTSKDDRTFPRELFQEIPPIPDFSSDPEALERYIGLITHTNFHYKASSKRCGIIPKLLRNLMHPSNINTRILRTTTMFNDMIYYFSYISDFAACREVYSQMKIEGVQPNTRTYNLLLRNLVKNSTRIRKKFPFKEALFYLKNMEYRGIQADPITWSECYRLLLDDISRDIFVEKMVEKQIPISADFLTAVLKSGNYNSTTAIKFLNTYSVPITANIFKFFVRKLIEEGNYESAWNFLAHASYKENFHVNCDCFNILLEVFAEKGRIDLCVLTFNTMKSTFNIKPSLKSYHLLFKALSRNGYHKNFNVIYEWLRNSMKKHTSGLFIKNYWVIKCKAISKFNTQRKVSADQLAKATSLIEASVWSEKGLKLKCWNEYSHLRKTFRLLGCLPTTVKPQKAYENTPLTVIEEKAAYKERIKLRAIKQNHGTKIPYFSNHFTALKAELMKRGILASEPDIDK